MVSLSTETISDFSNWNSCQVVFYKWSHIKMSKAMIQWNSATNCDTFVRSLEVRRGQTQCAIGSHHYWYFIYCSMVTFDFRKVRSMGHTVWVGSTQKVNIKRKRKIVKMTQNKTNISYCCINQVKLEFRDWVTVRLSKWCKFPSKWPCWAGIKSRCGSLLWSKAGNSVRFLHDQPRRTCKSIYTMLNNLNISKFKFISSCRPD